MSEDYVLELEHIRKEYPGVVALKDVTLQLRRGEVLGLIGENGTGKTTTDSGSLLTEISAAVSIIWIWQRGIRENRYCRRTKSLWKSKWMMHIRSGWYIFWRI